MKKNFIYSLLFSFILFVLSIIFYAKFSYMGVTNSDIQNYIINNYKTYILLYNIKILLFYLLIAAIISVFLILLKLNKSKEIIIFNLFIWFFFWLRAIKIYPQMFTEQLFLKGGILKYYQIFITDFIPLWSIYLLFAIVIVFISYKKKSYIGGMIIIITLFLILYPYKTIAGKYNIKTKKPNILILASDSLRPDHISYNGYKRKTPNIDYLFKRGVNFLNLTASMGRTFPSWVSVMTSMYPPEHGIRHMFPDFEVRRKKWITLVDILRGKGYFTGVISDFAGDIFSRIDLGFEKTDSPYFSIKTMIKQRSLEIHYFFISFFLTPQGKRVFPVMYEMALDPDPYLLTEKTKSRIKQAEKQKKPFFILTFYSCNHFPYSPKYPYYKLYTDKSYKGVNKYKKENLLAGYNNGKIPRKDREQIIALYDGGIRMFDDQVGDIIGFLKKSGLAKNTYIIIMSDHGENLYEYSYGMGHGDHLRGNFANNMTFGIFSPFESFKGRRIKPTARDIDISPTILDLLKIKKPKQFKGYSLLPYMRGKRFRGFPAYIETGIWYTKNIPAIPEACRIDYPQITELMKVDKITGEIYLKERYKRIIIDSKQRAIVFNNHKYIYIPCEKGIINETYNTIRPQIPKFRNRLALRGFFTALLKQQFFKFFPDKFRLINRKYIIEKNIRPDNLKNGLLLYTINKKYLYEAKLRSAPRRSDQ